MTSCLITPPFSLFTLVMIDGSLMRNCCSVFCDVVLEARPIASKASTALSSTDVERGVTTAVRTTVYDKRVFIACRGRFTRVLSRKATTSCITAITRPAGKSPISGRVLIATT